MRAAFIALALLAGVPCAAADLAIEGKWMLTAIENRGASGHGKLKFHPGTMIVEIHGASMVTTMALDPGAPPEVIKETIAVKEAGEAKVVAVISGGDDPPGTATITREGAGLIFTSDKDITHLAPWDADAVAKAAAARQDEQAPAAPIVDHPLAGRFAGAAWTATVCRRAQIVFPDDDGISVEILAEKPADAFAPVQHLMVTLPQKPGTYPLGPQRSVTFYTPPGKNVVAGKGQLVVEKIDGNTVTFALSACADADHEVDGTMTVDLGPAP